MAAVDEFTDSTDWLDTPLRDLAPLESALRCQVCKDFFSTPMITSCSHTFCSLCIRRYLSQEGKCPACRESDQEMKLRRNWAVDELVAHFTQSRKTILEFAKHSVTREETTQERPKKRRKVEHKVVDGVERRSTRSQTRQIPASQTSQDLPSTQSEVADSDDEGSVYEISPPERREPHDGLVECPCCHRRMKEAAINSHLDRCIAGQAGNTPSPSTTPTPQIHPGSIAYSQTKPSMHKERLPTINYSVMNETNLRKKLKELGIPTIGTKETLRKRHTEWVNLWNANCDSQQPKSKRDLLRELDVWERTLHKSDKGTNGVMAKEFDRDQWQQSNKNNFDDLIRQAREQRKAALTQKAEDQSNVQTNEESVDELQSEGQNGVVPLVRSNHFTDALSTQAAMPGVKQEFSMQNENEVSKHGLKVNGYNVATSGNVDTTSAESNLNGNTPKSMLSQRSRMFE